jgi:hypothetical protein
MADSQNDYFAALVVYPVEDSIGPASCTPDAFQLTSQGSANSVRVLQ